MLEGGLPEKRAGLEVYLLERWLEEGLLCCKLKMRGGDGTRKALTRAHLFDISIFRGNRQSIPWNAMITDATQLVRRLLLRVVVFDGMVIHRLQKALA